jgi:hypothetical protein
MDEDKKDRRTPIMFSGREIEQIDDWRHVQRIWSRGEAIRQLVQLGLAGPTFPDSAGSTPSEHPDLPPELIARIQTYRDTRPYLETRAEALRDLVTAGLDLADGRDDLLELASDMLAHIRRFAGPNSVAETATRMLRDAISAYYARWDLQKDEAD